MFFNVIKPKDILKNEEKFEHKTLLEGEHGSLNLISLKKEEIIDTHTSIQDAGVFVVKGEIEIHFDAEKFELKEGEMIFFKKDKEHKVLAKKDSLFLLIKID